LNVFVETNFVLELALQQQERLACEDLLNLASVGQIKLYLPAYSLVEPHETLTRRHRERKQLGSDVSRELTQLARTAPLAQRAEASQIVVQLLIESAEEEARQLEEVKVRIVSVAEIIPLTHDVVRQASECQSKYDLSPQDAIVYASIRATLEREHADLNCFVSRNPADFDDPDLREDLSTVKCKYFSSFTTALQFIRHSIARDVQFDQ
jgi:predicted nucleic acid-binding protein